DDRHRAQPRSRLHRCAVPRQARQRPQGGDPDPGVLRSARRHDPPRRYAPHRAAEAQAVRPYIVGWRATMTTRRFWAIIDTEEKRSRWGGWPSKPERAVSRFLVGSTPTLFRHLPIFLSCRTP